MIRHCQALFVLVLLTLLLSACDTGSTAPATIAATQPAGATLPPARSGASVSTGSTAALRDALNRTKSATTYRMSLDFEIGTTENGTLKQQTFLKFDGEQHGDASQVTYSGGIFNDMLGGGERIEIISLDGRSYLKGSSLFGTADPAKWYVLADSAISKPPFDLNALLLQTGDDLEGARIISTTTLDGQSCETWQLDFKNGAGALIEIAGTDETRANFNTLDRADARFTRCADNLLHQLTWDVQAHNSQNANAKGNVLASIHLFDFDASNITIAAPPDATELR
jgi:hypothetical protein